MTPGEGDQNARSAPESHEATCVIGSGGARMGQSTGTVSTGSFSPWDFSADKGFAILCPFSSQRFSSPLEEGRRCSMNVEVFRQIADS